MRWSYKTIHFELKKEGLLGSAVLDESEVELSLNEFGRAGWELVSILETMDGIIAIFKQPLSGDSSPLFEIESEENSRREVFEETDTGLIRREDGSRSMENETESLFSDEIHVLEDDSNKKDESLSPKRDAGAIRIE